MTRQVGFSAAIGVCDLMNADTPSPGVGLLRALRADPAFRGSLIALPATPFDSGAYLDGIADSVRVLPLSGGPRSIVERLREIRAETPIDVLFPGSARAARPLAEAAAALGSEGVTVVVPGLAALRGSAERALSARCARADIRCSPVESSAEEEPELEKNPIRVRLPKGNTYTLRSVAQLHALLAFTGDDAFLWQALPSGVDVQAALIADRRSRVVSSASLEVISRGADGAVWLGASFSDPKLDRMLRAIVRALDWFGPLTLNLVRTAERSYVLQSVEAVVPSWIEACRGEAAGGMARAAAIVGSKSATVGTDPAPLPSGLLIAHYAQDIPVSMSRFSSLSLQRGAFPHAAREAKRPRGATAKRPAAPPADEEIHKRPAAPARRLKPTQKSRSRKPTHESAPPARRQNRKPAPVAARGKATSGGRASVRSRPAEDRPAEDRPAEDRPAEDRGRGQTKPREGRRGGRKSR
jgi:carbamoyl-phosphate synthase large subunit